ncbi:MAG TPA: hypothetical protein VFW92_06100 [Candidatus Limnocylindrales bacterium]|nr:hypothetical protein [Candidatus Limnocylindrales bacterium]
MALVLTAACSGGGGTPAPTEAPLQSTEVFTLPPSAPSAAAWPDGWEDICLALTELQTGWSDFTDALDDAEAFDYDSASKEAKSAGSHAKTAVGVLDGLPTWTPGKGIVGDLRTAATNMQKAGNLLSLGLKNIDADLVDEVAPYVDKINDALDDGIVDETDINATYGFGCS